MNAAGILRVGIFTLIFSTTLIAETIPFDYWYGRIVGGQQPTIEYSESRAERAMLQLSHSFGDRNDFVINANRFWKMWPGSNATPTAYEPTLSGRVQLSKSLRLEIPLVDYHWTNGAYNYPQFRSGRDSSAADIQVGVFYLSDGGIQYTKDRSLSLFVDGPVPAKGETAAEATARFVGINISDRWGNNLDRPLLDQSIRNLRDRSIEVEVAARRGYSNNLVLGIGGSYRRLSHHVDRRSIRIVTRYDTVIDTFDAKSGYDATEDWGRFGLTARYILDSKSWINGSVHFRHNIVRSMAVGDYPDLPYLPFGFVSGESKEYFVGDFEVRFNRFSKSVMIERQKLLDNFSKYYADQLDRGNWSVEAKTKWSITERKSEEYGIGWLDYRPADHVYMFDVDLNLRYYARANLYFDCDFSFASITDTLQYRREATQFQELRPRFAASYQTYVWDPNLRREISWEQVSDLDYSLGPLLRAGDWRVLVFVEPPYKKSREPMDWGSLPGTSHLTWKDDWKTAVDGAIGIVSNVECNLRLHWNRFEVERRGPSSYSEELTLAPGGAIQIRQFLRLTGQFENKYSRFNYAGYGFEDYEQTWSLKGTLDVRF